MFDQISHLNHDTKCNLQTDMFSLNVIADSFPSCTVMADNEAVGIKVKLRSSDCVWIDRPFRNGVSPPLE